MPPLTALALALAPALPGDRQALLAELAHLKRRRGASHLDGAPFDGAGRLAEIESALVVLEDADAVAVQRERGAAGDAEAERIARLKDEILAANEARLSALSAAEDAFSFVVEQLTRVAALSEQIRVAGAQLQAPAQIVFDPRVVEKRLAAFVTPGLLQLGSGGDFGDIELRPSPVIEPARPWAEAERAVSAGSVARLLSGPPEIAKALLRASPVSFNELSNPAEAYGEPEAADLETVTAERDR